MKILIGSIIVRFVNSMKKTIKKYLRKIKYHFVSEKQKESNFYKKLFIENEHWNTPKPNEEEVLRWEIIKDFLSNIKKDDENVDILDLGSGRGWLTNLLANYGNVVGVEPVKSVVGYSRTMFPNIKFICGTSKTLIRGKNFKKYDLIVTSEVIEHIPDHSKESFIEDISKLLNEKGFLIITTPRKEVEEQWKAYIGPNQPVEDWITEKELEELVLKKHFSTLRLERFGIPPMFNVPDIEIYQLWLFQKK
ncbi:class I SAM-dependent methyltransferase [Flavobacterium tiangeerense]|uniref:class I SAM-dependent methyltransferase n=1 Tax=Flavobacterium tiangeerense TaxID=459471 RepID=UPI0011A44C15|nr:class I SAM-dependent methyltransferase [Flavobacterium tiangeerense]